MSIIFLFDWGKNEFFFYSIYRQSPRQNLTEVTMKAQKLEENK